MDIVIVRDLMSKIIFFVSLFRLHLMTLGVSSGERGVKVLIGGWFSLIGRPSWDKGFIWCYLHRAIDLCCRSSSRCRYVL